MTNNPFEKLKARYCLIAIAVALYLQPGLGYVVAYTARLDWFWTYIAFHYYAHAVIAAALLVLTYKYRLDLRRLFGRKADRADVWLIVKLDSFLFCLASFLVVFIYIPVSYMLPDFAAWWLAWMYTPMVYLTASGEWSVIANIFSLISLAVFAPVLEEILFRGLLLHRFALKWGTKVGMLASSALFGALHPDPLGAAVFGVGMCFLYLHTRSLYVPIIAHGLYNLVIWIWEFWDVATTGLDYYTYTVEQFRGDWEIGAVGGLVAVVMIQRHFRSKGVVLPRRLLVS